MNTIAIKNEERFFASFATAFIGRKVEICKAEGNALGYTADSENGKPVRIAISRNNRILEELPGKFRTLFRFGILVHELLHQLYTDFHTFRCYIRRLDGNDRTVFKTVFNIFEDARIEYHADGVCGDDALDALKFDNDILFELSPPIRDDIGDYEQLISAMIMIKNRGRYKGSLSDRASGCLDKIIGFFSDATESCIGSECVRLSYEAAKVITSMLDCSAAEKICSKNAISEIKSDSSGRDFDNHDDNGEDKKSGVSSFRTDGGASDDNTDDSCGQPEPDSEEIKDTFDKYDKKADSLGEFIETSCSRSAETVDEPDSFSDGRFTVFTEKAEAGDWGTYSSLCHAFSHEINTLAARIKSETATVPSRRVHSKSGKINIERISNEAYTGTRLFDKKKEKEDHSVAVMIAVDCSGSMFSGKKIDTARLAAIIIAEAFAKAKMPIRIIGYSTDCRGENGIRTDFVSWNNTAEERCSLTGMQPENANLDGPTIRCCMKELDKRCEKNKVLVIISDGCPNAYGYQGISAVTDTGKAISEAKKRADVIGISLDMENYPAFRTMYGEKGFISLTEIDMLPGILAGELKKRSVKW